eukprot:scaffold13909_cov63-Phaeocystis_antarctica.AAC.4
MCHVSRRGLGFLRAVGQGVKVLELCVVDALPIRAEVLLKVAVHRARPHERAEVLRLPSFPIDQEELEVERGVARTAQAVARGEGVVERPLGRRGGVQSRKGGEPPHGVLCLRLAAFAVLPELRHGTAALRALGILVEDYRVVRRVEVVAVRPTAQTHRDLLALEDKGQAAVVRHARDEVAPCKREARRPEGLQHRLGRKQRRLLRLSAVPHVWHGVVALRKRRDAHDGAGRPESVAFVVERPRHVRKVRAEDRVLVARAAPLLQKVLVPPERKRDMRVDLQHKRLSSVHAARDVTRENGTGGVTRVHPIDTNPAEVLAPHVSRPRLLSVAHRRAIWVTGSKDALVDDGN